MRSANDVAALSGWNADWAGLRVAVLGLGVTGFSVADTLAELRAVPLVLANRADERLADLLDVLGVRLVVDALDRGLLAQNLAEFAPELVLGSPGFPPNHPLV
jgi:UDP-N-acetylmuramoylalanine--D-glutamate ligase